MHTNNERGIALVLALFLTAALSTLAASLMFLAQSETYATMNYRMMSQARYAGEAGIQKAANFLLDRAQYTVPKDGGADNLLNYNRAVSPVTYNNLPVVLSAKDAACSGSNYPVAAIQTAFCNFAKGSLAAGNAGIKYNAQATLVTMQQFEAYGGTDRVVQTWEITGIGGLTGPRNATVEVVALIETPKVPANSYAAFATSAGCGAISFQGNVTVNSYDSSEGPPTGAGNSTEASGGDVGTNGNLQIGGSVAVQGNLYTPRTGVGTCEEGSVTALSATGSATVTGSTVALPKAIVYPPPSFTAIPPTTPMTVNGASMGTPATACASLGTAMSPTFSTPPGMPLVLFPAPGWNCTVSGTTITIDNHGLGEVTMPSVTVASGYTLKIVGSSPGQNVNINALNGDGAVEIQANMTGPLNESVVLKIAGKNADGTDMVTPFDLSAMSWKQNSAAQSYDASALQIAYGGTANISMKGGNTQSAAMIYAPNASFTLQGTQDLFGSVLARTITNGGNANIHYDRHLSASFFVIGQAMVGTFTWKRF